jgi:hypothetical protein
LDDEILKNGFGPDKSEKLKAKGLAVPGAAYLCVVLVAGAFGLVPVLRRPRLFAGIVRPLQRLHAGWVVERLYTFGGALERFGRQPGRVGLAFAGALVVQMLLVVFFLISFPLTRLAAYLERRLF